jgi:hypothetical protein
LVIIRPATACLVLIIRPATACLVLIIRPATACLVLIIRPATACLVIIIRPATACLVLIIRPATACLVLIIRPDNADYLAKILSIFPVILTVSPTSWCDICAKRGLNEYIRCIVIEFQQGFENGNCRRTCDVAAGERECRTALLFKVERAADSESQVDVGMPDDNTTRESAGCSKNSKPGMERYADSGRAPNVA